MGVLLIFCPRTGKEFSTGVQVDCFDQANILPDVRAWARCPYCYTEHAWRPKNARFVELAPH